MRGYPAFKFWIGLAMISCITIVVSLSGSSKPLRVESDAEAAICRDMAGEVLAGEASRFDYMATRCPARLLVSVEDA